jgi:hypothetical protein
MFHKKNMTQAILLIDILLKVSCAARVTKVNYFLPFGPF